MSDDTVRIPMTEEQACLVVPLLREEAAARRENGDRLIVGTNSRQAGFNSHDVATRLLSLADLIVHEFPYLDEEDDEY